MKMAAAKMKRGVAGWIACGLVCAWSSVAFAQAGDDASMPATVEEDPTAKPTDGEEGGEVPDSAIAPTQRMINRPAVPTMVPKETPEGPVRWRIRMNNTINTRDNMDFRVRNEVSPQEILNSDDRLTYGAAQVRAGVDWDVAKGVTMGVGVGHTSIFGLRALGDENMLFFDAIKLGWTPVDTESVKFTATFGRQFFNIGGAPRDYFMSDLVDGLVLDLDLKEAGRLRVLAVDIIGTMTRPDETTFQSRQNTISSDLNFRGDNYTVRTGAVYELTQLVEGLDARAFGFFADIGSGRPGATGSDRVYGGQLGNFTDNDYTWMGGLRAGYTYKTETLQVGGYGEFARSGGIDRKDRTIGLFDVVTEGNAFGAGLMAQLKSGTMIFDVNGNFFRADGPQYASSNGMQFNHGFVSFKGNQVGGLALDDTAGWHPSAYVGSWKGVEDSPQEQERKAGTQVISGQIGVAVQDAVKVQLGIWHLQSTGSTGVNEGNIDQIARELPYGYSEADLRAQTRIGKTLGTEFDLGLTYLASETLNVFAVGAIFTPGDYYAQEISRSGGSALGSSDPQNFWVVTAGMSLNYLGASGQEPAAAPTEVAPSEEPKAEVKPQPVVKPAVVEPVAPVESPVENTVVDESAPN
jgi:hypothetical protein